MVRFTRVLAHPEELKATPEACGALYGALMGQTPQVKDEPWTRIWSRNTPTGEAQFLKEYRIPAWKRLLSLATRSRGLREWKALHMMERAGLPVPRALWAGELRNPWGLQASVLATASLGSVRPLPEHLGVLDAEDALRICHALGALAARLHQAGFVHFRMQAKNFMMREGSPEPCMLDLPYTTFWADGVPPRLRRLDLEDLAGAHSIFSPEQVAAIMTGYSQAASETDLASFRPGSRSRWGQKLRRIAYYLGAIWTGHRP